MTTCVSTAIFSLCLLGSTVGLAGMQTDSLAADSLTDPYFDATESPTVLRGAFFTLFSRRNATLAGEIGRGTGVHPGLEFEVWAPRVWGSSDEGSANTRIGIASLGVYARMMGGGFSIDSSPANPGNEAVGEVNNADIEAYVGYPVLHARVGYGLRSLTGTLGTARWSYWRVGARSTFSLGSSEEFEVTLGLAFYLGVRGETDGSGREGETRLTFVPQCGRGSSVTTWICRRITGIVAYRFEQFTTNIPSGSGGNRPEEISSVIVGIGIRPR